MKFNLFFTILILTTIDQSFSMVPTEQQNLNSQLAEAVIKGNKAKIAYVLQAGANVDAKDSDGWAPLHWAVSNGDTEIAELLLAQGADINAEDTNGITPLHKAASNDATAIVEQLLSKGADINARDNLYGYTALHCAVIRGYTSTAELLLAQGADINAKTNSSLTPLHYAAVNGYTATVDLLKAYQALLEQAQKPTKKLLEIAIEHGYYGLVKLLLQRGLKPNIRHLQLAKNKWQTAEYKQSYKAIGRLLLTQLSLAPGKELPIPGCISRAGIVGLYGLPESVAQNIATYFE